MADPEFKAPASVVRPSYMEANYDLIDTPRQVFDSDVVKNIDDELEEVQDCDFIKTFLRIREPSLKPGEEEDAEEIFEIESKTTLVVKHPVDPKRNKSDDQKETRFMFSGILDPTTPQISVFEECAQPIVDKFMKGESCLVFSYGATNSGKTYTMQGYGTNFGIIPRTLDYLFNRLEDRIYQKANIKPNQFDAHCEIDDATIKIHDINKNRLIGDSRIKVADLKSFCEFRSMSRNSSIGSEVANRHKIQNLQSLQAEEQSRRPAAGPDGIFYSVWVSYIEVYNERVYDLFETVPKGRKRKELRLYQDKQGQVFVNDLTEFSAKSAEEAYQLFLSGRENLQFATTKINENSSRSHSFYNIRIVTQDVRSGYAYPLSVYRLSFCDLAGIERVSQTGNVGERLKESGNINHSLLVLLRCIRAMRDKQLQGKNMKANLPPFRESKLARLFKSYLTTSSQICMLVTINPEARMYESSFQVLSNSAVASKVQLVRRVEPPVYNNDFCRKVRESMGLLAPAIQKDMEESDVISEAEENNTPPPPSPAYVNYTVTRQDLCDRLSELEKENEQLRNKMFKQDALIRDEVRTKFEKICADQEKFYKSIIDDERKHADKVALDHVKLAKDYFARQLAQKEAIARSKLVAASTQVEKGDIVNINGNSKELVAVSTQVEKGDVVNGYGEDDEVIPRSELVAAPTQVKKDDTVNVNGKLEEFVTASTQVEKSDVVNVNGNSEDDADEDEDYKAKYFELKAQLEEKAEKIDDLTNLVNKLKNEQKSTEFELKLTQKAMSDLESQINKKMRASMAAKEYQMKQKELDDAMELCKGYHAKLEEANGKLVSLQDDYNRLFKENERIKDEEEYVHLTVEELQNRNSELEATIQILKSGDTKPK